MTEFFIAKRYLHSKHKLNFISIISWFSVLGITIGVAALVIVLSVFNGFGSLVKEILINFDPHVRITFTSENALNEKAKIETFLNNEKEVQTFAPFVEGRVIIFKKKHFEIITLKGLSEKFSNADWGLSTRIIAGTADLKERDKIPSIVLGLPIALKLSVRVGDTVSVISADKIQRSAFSYSLPTFQTFRVSGIFDINNKKYAEGYAYTLLQSAQKTLGLVSTFNGYEIRLKNISKSNSVKSKIIKAFGGTSLKVDTWYDMHKNLYNVMLIERWTAYLILSLIIAVATFNILSSLTMSVLEKQKDIAILRSMGLGKNGIKKIFMYQGILIGFLGTIAGTLLGLAVCYIQIHFNIYPLDPTKYIIDSLPVQIRWTDVVVISLMSFVLTWLASLYPARKSLKINIIQAIKWE